MTDDGTKDHPFGRAIRAAGQIEESLGLKPGFLVELSEETDWSFVIKTSAVIEAALEQHVRKHCFASKSGWAPRDEAKFEKFVRDLPMDGRTGKIQLANAYGMLLDRDLAFIKSLQELRNRYAHRPSNISKSIREMFGSGKEAKRKLQDLLMVDVLEGTQPVADQGVRFLAALTACSVLWSIQFHTQPPASLGLGLLMSVGDG